MPVSWQNLLDEASKGGGGNYDPLPIGDYSVVIDEATHTNTQSGKLMFKTKMKVEGGPHNGRFVWNQFVVSPESPNALSIFFSQMRALGLSAEFFAGQPGEDAICGALAGRRCNVTLAQREWKGQVRNEVKTIKPAVDGAALAAAPTVAAANTAAPAAPMTTPSAPSTNAPAAPF